MRCINHIWTTSLGERWENRELLAVFEPHIERLPLPEEERGKLRDFVRFQLVGSRCRRSFVRDWAALGGFDTRAPAFQAGVDEAAADLAAQISASLEGTGVVFDAVLATTATGGLMPGISYRIAHRLPGRVRPDSMLLDLSNVGCTGSSKALNLARSLDPSYRNILIVAVEVPSTLADLEGTSFALWQGNCTFGDGAAAVWVSQDPEQGETGLALEDLRYTQRSEASLDLIHWTYRSYYSFGLGNEATFDADVREHVVAALAAAGDAWKDEPRWAIHPAGITLLVRISRKLGIAREAIQPSVDHYNEHSNMSSASVLHILRDVARETPAGAAINLLTMGAGFNVIYGRVRRVR